MSALDQTLNLAVAYHQAGNLLQAEQLYRQILQVDPRHVDALHLLGIVLVRTGQPSLGCDCIRQALRLKPDFAEAHSNLGKALRQLGRLEEAAASLEEALRLQPNFAIAHSNLGNVRRDQGHLHQAILHYQEALRLNPDFVDALCNLGVVLRELGQVDEAIAHCRQALRLKPTFAVAHCNLGTALLEKKNLPEAEAHLREAIRLAPQYADAHSELGRVLVEDDRLAEALASLSEALRLQPDHAEALNNRALVLVRQGKRAEAVAALREALRTWPTHAWMHVNLGSTLLLTGDLEAGWPEYEWRWKTREYRPPNFTQPRWDGGPLKGKTILLHAEQGLGDTLQFIRYAPLINERGGRVLVECQPILEPLLQRSPGVDLLVPAGAALPPFDVHALLVSLPFLFKTTLTTIPAKAPYLFADRAFVEKWRQELGPIPGFKVGIVWQGSSIHKWDRFRSMPLAELAPLARVPGVKLFSLQVGPGSSQLASCPFPVTDLAGRFDPNSFADAAAAVMNLDLVITVDTALAHLAGGLGKPVWLALDTCPDWRWLLEREDCPWYPSARLFRQRSSGAWGEVSAQMASELARKVPD
jgi:tetratricopeptide (TPR) repeat protein